MLDDFEARKKMKQTPFYEEITQWDQDYISEYNWGEDIISLIKQFRKSVFEFEDFVFINSTEGRLARYDFVRELVMEFPEEMTQWKKHTLTKYYE